MENIQLWAVTLRDGNKHMKFCTLAPSPEGAREKVTTLVEKAGLSWKPNSIEPEVIEGAYFGSHDGTIIPVEEVTVGASA
jgi:hypothetical protein